MRPQSHCKLLPCEQCRLSAQEPGQIGSISFISRLGNGFELIWSFRGSRMLLSNSLRKPQIPAFPDIRMFLWFLYQSTRVPPDSYKPLLILTNSHNLPNKVLHRIPTVFRRARGPQKNLSEFSCSVGKISQSFLVLPEKSLRVFFFCQENAFPQFRFSSKAKSLKISGN